MCLAIPAQVVELKGATALVLFAGDTGHLAEIGRILMPGARPGDWVFVNAGQIVSLVPEGEVAGLLALIEEVNAAR
jgi:hydrogenase maturation factor